MKKLFVSLLLTSIFFSAQSQLNQGTWLAGGTASFYSYTSDYSSTIASNQAKFTQINLSATVGYFVIDKLAFGLKPTFSSIKNRDAGQAGGNTNIQRYWFGPFGRYYFLDKEKPFNIVTDVSYQYGFLGGSRVKGNLNTFSALFGPVLYFNSSVGLEFLLGYSSSKEDAELGIKEIRKGFQTAIGFQIHLEK